MSTSYKRNFKQYDVVEIMSFFKTKSIIKSKFDIKKPDFGDIVTIVEIYSKPTIEDELECSNPNTGETLWLQTFAPSEIQL